MTGELKAFLQQLNQLLQEKNQRIVLECVGDTAHAKRVFQQLLRLNPEQKHLVVSNNDILANSVPFNKTQQLLGQEFDLLWFDAAHGMAVDAFLRVVSVLRAPSVVLLSHPQAAEWLTAPDNTAKWQNQQQGTQCFLRYFIQQLQQSAAVVRLEQDGLLPNLPDLPLSEAVLQTQQTRTAEQQAVWQALQQFLMKDDKQICLFVAKRGRGKSTLLGQLLSDTSLKHYQFVLISQAKKATQACLKYLASAQNTRYKSIDDYLQKPIHCDCIVVDEAATISIAQLQALTKLKIKIIFTTTLEGYEGTGSGFTLSFLPSLDQNKTFTLTLNQAIRWGQQDALEQCVNDIFLLEDQELLEAQELTELKISQCSQQQLSDDIALLKQVFQLLKSSHYRTQASDLKALLDNPDLTLFLACNKQSIVGVAIAVQEGGFDTALCKDIAYGNRRPQGHLLAQIINAQTNETTFAKLKGCRIQRIAVAQNLRQQGIGRQLIHAIEHFAQQHQLDYIGASFALSSQHLQFWKALKLQLVHIGVGQGTTTGLPSVVLLKALKASSKTIQNQLITKLQQQFPQRLLTQFNDMDSTLVQAILRVMPPFSGANKSACEPYIKGHKGFEYAWCDLSTFSLSLLQKHTMSPHHVALLVQAILQYQNPDKLVKRYNFTGKKQLQQTLKSVFIKYLSD